MDVETIASLYVNVIEPVGRVLVFALIAIFILWLFSIIQDSGKKKDVLNSLVSGVGKLIVGVFVYTGAALLWFGKFLLRAVTVIFATVRDFFTSKI